VNDAEWTGCGEAGYGSWGDGHQVSRDARRSGGRGWRVGRSPDVIPQGLAPGGHQARGGNPKGWPDSTAPGRGGTHTQAPRGSSRPSGGAR